MTNIIEKSRKMNSIVLGKLQEQLEIGASTLNDAWLSIPVKAIRSPKFSSTFSIASSQNSSSKTGILY